MLDRRHNVVRKGNQFVRLTTCTKCALKFRSFRRTAQLLFGGQLLQTDLTAGDRHEYPAALRKNVEVVLY